MSPQIWIFLNHEDGAKIRFNGDVAAARAFMQVLKTHCHGQWGLLGENSQAQPPVEAIAVIPNSIVAKPVTSAAPAAMTSSELPGVEDIAEPEMSSAPPSSVPMPASVKEKRQSVRYNFPFRVILTSNGKSFRSQCQDISIGGMKLKHRPPEAMWNQICHVFIGSLVAAENIELKCRLIPDPKSPLRVCFVDASQASLKRLEEWIRAAAENVAKKAA